MASRFWSDADRKRQWQRLSAAYCVIVLGAIAAAAWHGFRLGELPPPWRVVVVLGGLVLSLLPTLYWWRTSWAFDAWIDGANLSDEEEAFERERFKINRDHALAVWAVILAVYAAFLIKG
jgi:hypothetical protein